jgi:hypothetical protein
MRRLVAAALVVVVAAAATLAVAQPPNLPCVTWLPWTSGQATPDPSTLFAASTDAWVEGEIDDPTVCLERGTIFPCWSSSQTAPGWGHHDYAGDIPSDYCRLSQRFLSELQKKAAKEAAKKAAIAKKAKKATK